MYMCIFNIWQLILHTYFTFFNLFSSIKSKNKDSSSDSDDDDDTKKLKGALESMCICVPAFC